MYWKDWCWSWNSNTLATWCEELTDLKRPWCWERLRAGGEGDNRRWDDWMASLTQWTRVWVDSGSWWWTGRPGILWSMGSRRVGHDWVTELNWTELNNTCFKGSWGWNEIPYKKPHRADDTQNFFLFFFFASVLGRALNISTSLLISAGYHTVLLIIGVVLYNRTLELFHLP